MKMYLVEGTYSHYEEVEVMDNPKMDGDQHGNWNGS